MPMVRGYTLFCGFCLFVLLDENPVIVAIFYVKFY